MDTFNIGSLVLVRCDFAVAISFLNRPHHDDEGDDNDVEQTRCVNGTLRIRVRSSPK